MSDYLPPFLSEFPDKIVTDCVPATGVMLANKATHGSYPASVAEREALQAAMGTQDVGANAAQLAAGMRARYGLQIGVGFTWANITAALEESAFGVALFGTYQSLPPDVRGHGNQPGFVGGHCIYAQGDGPGTATIGDPLANGFLPGVPIAELQAFCNGLGNQHLATLERVYQVGLRAIVGPGRTVGYRVVRFTHTLYSPLAYTWQRASSTPVRHGSPGFWLSTAGYYLGRYLVANRSGAFRVQAVMSDGSTRDVPVGS